MNTVLIVEDQKTIGMALAWMLKRHGYESKLVTSGRAAWELMGREDWRLVITDWIMPDLDGLELCRLIRARQGRSYAYVIMLTGRSGRDHRLQGLEAGADDFLIKPVDEDELLVRLGIARRILGIQAELEEKNARLDAMAHTDPLTGLANRRQLQGSLSAPQPDPREDRPHSVVALDIDHFKSYNDTFGHAAGDDVLCSVARILRENVRQNDLVVRAGGEEFVIMMPGMGEADALAVADRLRQAIASHAWPGRPVTASFGVATAPGPHEPRDFAAFLDEADRALYHGKQTGRNRVTHFRHLARSGPSGRGQHRSSGGA
jgi:diguanylate cyclase (GGDEF)-like protein